MSSSTETGHGKNVSNFETLISFCTGYGAKYQPSQDVLKVANLQTQYIAVDEVLDACITTATLFDNATDNRRDAFAGIKPLATRIVNAFAASGIADSVLEGAKTINHKLQGTRATPQATPKKAADGTEIPATTGSSSQLGYDSLIEHLTDLIELISSQEAYNPNEVDLKVVNLEAYLTGLKTFNTSVKDANTNWSNNRIERDAQLYAPKTGVVDTALSVKGYIKSAFGATSDQFKQVSGVAFTRN